MVRCILTPIGAAVGQVYRDGSQDRNGDAVRIQDIGLNDRGIQELGIPQADGVEQAIDPLTGKVRKATRAYWQIGDEQPGVA